LLFLFCSFYFALSILLFLFCSFHFALFIVGSLNFFIPLQSTGRGFKRSRGTKQRYNWLANTERLVIGRIIDSQPINEPLASV
jgi:hypothetical protein